MRVTLVAPQLAENEPLSRRLAQQAAFFRQRGDQVIIYVAEPPAHPPAAVAPYLHPAPAQPLGDAARWGDSDLYVFHCQGFYGWLESLPQIERGVVVLYLHPPLAPTTPNATTSVDPAVSRLLSFADLVVTEGNASQAPIAEADVESYHVLPADGRTTPADYAIYWAEVVARATAELPNRPYPYGQLPALAELHPRPQTEAGLIPHPSDEPRAALLAAELQALQSNAKTMQRDYVVRSRLPLLGSLLSWLRRNLTSHLREPYIDPTFDRQEQFNRQLAQTLALLAEQQGAALAALEARLNRLEEQVAALAPTIASPPEGQANPPTTPANSPTDGPTV